jgi:hypothetical protein
LSRLPLLLLVLLPLTHAAAAPFTPSEVARRMKAGTQLSAFCRMEANVNKVVTGRNCGQFMDWTEREFPLLEPGLERASASVAADFEIYMTNLTAILAIAEAAKQPMTFAPPPRL